MHRLVLGAGLIAALPVIVDVVRALSVGWVPIGDDAVIATRAYDVLTSHSPLLGQPSGLSQASGEATNSLGPLEYWLLALPARFWGADGLTVTVGIVNVASVVGVVALAKRRGGAPLMFAAAAAVAVMCNSFGAEAMHSVWNPYAALMPFTLLAFLSWSLACGEYRLLPLTIAVASFAVQCHVTYALPGVGLLAVAAVGLIAGRRQLPAGALRRWAIAAGIVGLVCWSAPLIEEALHRPGNMVLVVRAATTGDPTLAHRAGGYTVVHAVGVPPWWLRAPRGEFGRARDVAIKPGALAFVSAGLILLVLAVLVAVGLRRRRADVAAAGAIALVLCTGLGEVADATPTYAWLIVSYTLIWGSIAGMFAWLAVGWGLATLFAPAARPGWRSSPHLVHAGLAAAAIVSAAAALHPNPDREEETYSSVRDLFAAIDRTPGDQVVRLEGGSRSPGLVFSLSPAIAYSLRTHGSVVQAPALSRSLGKWYGRKGVRPDHVVRFEDWKHRSGRGRLLGRVSEPSQGGLRVLTRAEHLAEPDVAVVLIPAQATP